MIALAMISPQTRAPTANAAIQAPCQSRRIRGAWSVTPRSGMASVGRSSDEQPVAKSRSRPVTGTRRVRRRRGRPPRVGAPACERSVPNGANVAFPYVVPGTAGATALYAGQTLLQTTFASVDRWPRHRPPMATVGVVTDARPARVHLDAASGLPLHPAARAALLAAVDQGWADPARLYAEGRRARLLLDSARESVASALGARPDEVVFTSSGTTALHLAVLG